MTEPAPYGPARRDRIETIVRQMRSFVAALDPEDAERITHHLRDQSWTALADGRENEGTVWLGLGLLVLDLDRDVREDLARMEADLGG